MPHFVRRRKGATRQGIVGVDENVSTVRIGEEKTSQRRSVF